MFVIFKVQGLSSIGFTSQARTVTYPTQYSHVNNDHYPTGKYIQKFDRERNTGFRKHSSGTPERFEEQMMLKDKHHAYF